MYIRCVTHLDRKTNTYYHTYKLVESTRTARGPRQRTVANLGSDFALPEGQWKELANRIEEILVGQKRLIQVDDEVETLAQRYAQQVIAQRAEEVVAGEEGSAETDFQWVDLNAVEAERVRSVGAEHVVLETVRELGLDEQLRESGLNEPMVEAAVGVIAARLIAPRSERAMHVWLQEVSALDELLGTSFATLSQDRDYRVGDLLLKRREALEAHLRRREADLFSLREQVMLYDLTNTFFEGSCRYNAKAKFAKSKEKRTDCPLVTLGLVMDGNGFPKRSRMFAGNVGETVTLQEVLAGLGMPEGEPRPLVVMDAGLTSEENLRYLREHHYDYLVVARQRRKEVPALPGFVVVSQKDGYEVRAAKEEKGEELIVYCESEAKWRTEEEVRGLFSQRYEEGLEKARRALLVKGGIKQYDKVLERLGRLKEGCKRVAHRYEVSVERQDMLATDITWERKPAGRIGLYVLRCNRKDLSEKEVWNLFNTLRDVEDAFRCLKSDLGLRLLHHQIERRTEAHLFISVLAYHVLHTIRTRLRLAGIQERWSTVRDSLSTQVRLTVVMPMEDGRIVHLRKTSRPESGHSRIYAALGFPFKPGKTLKTVI